MKSTQETKERWLVITREFNAPRELVWKAWTEPEHFMRWWGPQGYTTPHCTIDLRPGGVIHFCMRSPEGHDIWGGGVIREIDKPSRFVFTDYFADEHGNPVSPTTYGMGTDVPEEMLITLTLIEEKGKTKLTMEQRIPESVAKKLGAYEGWNQSFDKLVDHLATGGARPIEITRVFDAPRSLVWKAWTDPDRLRLWWGPAGFTTPACKVDLRPGGRFHYCMRSPEGREFWGLGIYRDVVEPERIVYTDSFADADGNPVPPSHYGMSADHPAETLVTVTFDDQGGRTRVTLRHFIPASVPEYEGNRQGWTEMLERLAGLLMKANAAVMNPGS